VTTSESGTFAAAEERMEQMIGTLLRVGVVVAASVASVGGVVFLLRHGSEPAFHGVFRGEPQDLRSVGGILRDVIALRGRAMIQLGLLLLIATPIARVALALYAFARSGDRRFVAITAVVLALLVFSLFGFGS
jgi:uncharacterized membrane protein